MDNLVANVKNGAHLNQGYSRCCAKKYGGSKVLVEMVYEG